MTARRLVVLAWCALLGSCFELPQLEPRDAARSDAVRTETVEDRPLRVVSVTVRDARGAEWPNEAAPRALSLVIEMSAPVALGADAEAVVLVSGEPDEALALDAERAPLTVATRERSLAADVRVEGPQVRVTPLAPLAPGAVATLLVAGWAETREGRRIEAASLTRLETSRDARAGAAVIASFPADGMIGVPTNATAFALALDGEVELAGEPIHGSIDGVAVPGVVALPRCSALGLPGVACLAWTPSPLAPGVELVLETTGALRDATGAVVPRSRVRVRTSEGVDDSAPRIERPSACPIDALAMDAGCALATDTTWSLVVRVAEPARLELTLPGQVLRALAPRGVAELVARGLEPGMDATGTLTVVDLAGLRTAVPVAIATHGDLTALTISEVCADPEGPEPAQEWIELANFGAVPARLEGISISDREDEVGTTLHTSSVVPPGARVIVAADGFDPDAAGVPPGAPLVTTGRALVSGGLSNAGEALLLRDGAGRRLAGVPALAGREGSCVVRAPGADPRADAPADFHYDACTPGS